MAGRLRVLISAYACEPGRGSEPGVGWNVAIAMARYHQVWVLTRASNRAAIEAEIAVHPVPNLRFAYYDLPRWAAWWKRGDQLYYYLWQLGAFGAARRLHRQVRFEIAHHATFVKYWAPSFVARLPVPFVWGPVGGGESAPRAFWRDFGFRGRCYEQLREVARRIGELDPLVRVSARRSCVALAATAETGRRMQLMGVRSVAILPAVGLGRDDFRQLEGPSCVCSETVRFVSIGNLLHLKGFHLGLRAFAAAGVPDSEYWVVGDGPERRRLVSLARSLGVEGRVTFFGRLPRGQALGKLQASAVLIHPSLHDSGGWVCLESMAAGKPVICLDLGGPALQVTPETGYKVDAKTPNQAVHDMSVAMRRLAEDANLRRRMGEAARRRVHDEFNWERKAAALDAYYLKALSDCP